MLLKCVNLKVLILGGRCGGRKWEEVRGWGKHIPKFVRSCVMDQILNQTQRRGNYCKRTVMSTARYVGL